MARIGTVGRTGASWSRPARSAGAAGGPAASTDETPPVRALVVLDGGRRETWTTVAAQDPIGAGRPSAGFVAQLLIASDPTLRPSPL